MTRGDTHSGLCVPAASPQAQTILKARRAGGGGQGSKPVQACQLPGCPACLFCVASLPWCEHACTSMCPHIHTITQHMHACTLPCTCTHSCYHVSAHIHVHTCTHTCHMLRHTHGHSYIHSPMTRRSCTLGLIIRKAIPTCQLPLRVTAEKSITHFLSRNSRQHHIAPGHLF